MAEEDPRARFIFGQKTTRLVPGESQGDGDKAGALMILDPPFAADSITKTATVRY